MNRPSTALAARLGILAATWLALAGCDRDSASTPAAPASAGPVAKPTVGVRPITPLLPRLQTHLAVDPHGNVYWTQESDPPVAGGDLVFVMGPEGVPQTVAPLDVGEILAALGMTGGRGAVRSLAVGPDDQLYALFTGSRGRLPICAVLRYAPAAHKLTVAADTADVTRASELGPSIDLARGTLLGSRQSLWLWLRHSDAAALLKLTPMGDRPADVRKVPPRAADGLDPPRLTGPGEDLSLMRDESLYFVDRPRATLWRIGPDGRATQAISLTGLSRAFPPPAGNGGHLYFVNDGGPKFEPAESPAGAPTNPLALPNLTNPVVFDYLPTDQRVEAFDRARLAAPANFPLQTLQPRQLLWDAATGTLIAFDATSGEILRLKLPRPATPAAQP